MAKHKARLLLIGGLAGCGKSTLAKAIARQTGFAILDKDTLTLPLVESLLVSLGSSANDRESNAYASIRPLEYKCLMDTVVENARLGICTIAVAPFIEEAVDPEWYAAVCDHTDADVLCVWVRASSEVMNKRLVERGLSRDRNKLDGWQEYLQKVEGIKPLNACVVFDSSEIEAEILATRWVNSGISGPS